MRADLVRQQSRSLPCWRSAWSLSRPPREHGGTAAGGAAKGVLVAMPGGVPAKPGAATVGRTGRATVGRQDMAGPRMAGLLRHPGADTGSRTRVVAGHRRSPRGKHRLRSTPRRRRTRFIMWWRVHGICRRRRGIPLLCASANQAVTTPSGRRRDRTFPRTINPSREPSGRLGCFTGSQTTRRLGSGPRIIHRIMPRSLSTQQGTASRRSAITRSN